jgi:hypothetical protein
MTTNVNWIIEHAGTPEASVFLNTRGQGTPIVIDVDTGTAYYYNPETGVQPLGFARLYGGNQFTGAQSVGFVTLTDDLTITIDASLSNSFILTLAGNWDRTLAAPINPRDGQVINVWLIQGAYGTRTFTFNSVFRWIGGSDPTLTTTSAAVDMITAQYNAALGYWVCNILQDFR